MQIIAGAAKGRRLKVPPSGTRPMTGRARESIFSILQFELVDARVLDLFAGSGSLGLEALSRGAVDAVFVDMGKKACEAIAQNIDTVGLGGSLVCAPVERALATVDGSFDIVFVDPPYADDDDDVIVVLTGIDRILAKTGVIVVHRQESASADAPDFLTSRDERRYGDARVSLYERKQP